MSRLTRLIKSRAEQIPEILIESKHDKLSHELRPGNSKKCCITNWVVSRDFPELNQKKMFSLILYHQILARVKFR
jgi:hypothetical protein